MGSIKRNTLHMLSSQAVMTVCQGLQFVIVARALGATEFGRLAAILAINSVLVPFSGLGSNNITIMRLARGSSEAPLCYGNSLMMGCLSGFALIGLALFASMTFLGSMASPGVILIFGIADFILSFSIGAAACVFFGLDKHRYASRFQSLQAFSRLCCAGAFVSLHKLGVFSTWSALYAQIWGWFYLLGSLIAAVMVYKMTVAQIGRPQYHFKKAVHDIKTGVFYSVSVAAMSVYTDIDKAVLARVATTEINGAYTAAYRVIAMSYAPVRALLTAMQARFFRDGAHSVGAAVRSASRVAMYATAYCLLLGLMMQFVVPIIPLILGKSYALSGEILSRLAFLPLFLMLQDVFSTALTGSDRQHLRSFVQVAAALLCFFLNMSLAPQYGWMGATVATYATQVLLAAMVVGVIFYSVRAERKLMRPSHLPASS